MDISRASISLRSFQTIPGAIAKHIPLFAIITPKLSAGEHPDLCQIEFFI